MNNQVVNAQKHRALDFFAKRRPRLLQQKLIGGGKVYKIVAMNGNGRDFCRSSRLTKEGDVF
jgi:hypothetical protein